MTPLIYFLQALDARVYVSIIDPYADKFLTDRTPLYNVLADKAFIDKYRAYDVKEVRIAKATDGIMTVYIEIID